MNFYFTTHRLDRFYFFGHKKAVNTIHVYKAAKILIFILFKVTPVCALTQNT